MKTFIVRILGAALLTVSFSTFATVLSLVGTATNPLGIDGVVVDGVTYDVSFSLTPTGPSPFISFSQQALDASSGLASALNTLGVTKLDGVTSFVVQYMIWLDWKQESNGTYLGDIAYLDAFTNGIPNTTWSSGVGTVPEMPGGCPNRRFVCNEFTDWKVAGSNDGNVPEPVTLYLLGAGLAGAALARRRKKN